MARRLGVAVLAAAVTVAIAGVVYMRDLEGSIRALRGSADHRLDLYAGSLEREIEKYARFPYVVGLHPDVVARLRGPADAALARRVDRYLETLNRRIGTAVVYVLDRTGRVVAASNWNEPDSFVGLDLSYRPYYRNTAIDRVERFYGIGTSGNRPGYYLATAVHENGVVVGTSVVKIDLEQLEQSWSAAESPAILTDEHGVISLSSVEAWKYGTLQPLDPAASRDIAEARQYHDRALAPIGMTVVKTLDATARIVDLPGQSGSGQSGSGPAGAGGRVFAISGLFLAQARMLTEAPWRLTVFSDLREAVDLARTRAVLAGLGVLLLGGASAALVQRQRHMRELVAARSALQRAHAELERKVADRTSELTAANARLVQEVEERRRAERALRDAQTAMVQAGKLAAICQFATGIVHELNRPLAAIAALSGNAVRFLERGDVETASGNLERIRPLVERMGRLTGELKGFARKSSGEAGAVRVRKSFDNALFLLHHRVVHGRVAVSEEIDAALVVRCDPNRLDQVLVNLIGNALDAMDGRDDGRLELVAAAGPAGFARLEIRDNGPGFSDEWLQHAFEPFYTTKAPGTGLGLGLAISAGIVRDFGGELGAARRAAGGAVFSLTIPLATERAS
ncbi:ATP-binding protein [Rhodoplanes sp. TEM]|uniref:sensor histidine kinase n=1 Tax=Rhodoplanes sp. TEM TaxID=3025489 RepID=UPI002350221D|nr:ATP-binding protein [Rhodoplanes sp. TEM]MDC7986585.1 ATP-binding protein [Rhodoplanes sp. TEM]